MSEGPKLYDNKPKKGLTILNLISTPSSCHLFNLAICLCFSNNIVSSIMGVWNLIAAQLKQFQQHQKGKEFPSTSSGTASYSMGQPPPPPPQPPKESFARRYKFLWPLLLAVNFTVGGHFLSFFTSWIINSFIWLLLLFLIWLQICFSCFLILLLGSLCRSKEV